jgi:hypothetical protein
MRQILTLLLLTTAITLSAQWGNRKTIKGNGDVTTETRSAKGFDGVNTCCDIDVVLVQGNFNVRVEAESNLQEYIKTNVNGGRLEIGFKSNINVKSHEQVTVYVSLPELEFIGASSSGKVTTESRFSGEEMRLNVSSGAKIELDFSGDDLYANASSGGGIVLKGSSSRFKANVSSGGNVRAGSYESKDARCNASSGGGVTVKVSGQLDANASSGGHVRYIGNPSNVDSDTSSGGSVRRSN